MMMMRMMMMIMMMMMMIMMMMMMMIRRITIGCITSLDKPVRRSESAFPATGQDIPRIVNDDHDDDDIYITRSLGAPPGSDF